MFVVPDPVLTRLVAGLGQGGELTQPPVRLWRALLLLLLTPTTQPKPGKITW